jgi:hypothetical protein
MLGGADDVLAPTLMEERAIRWSMVNPRGVVHHLKVGGELDLPPSLVPAGF